MAKENDDQRLKRPCLTGAEAILDGLASSLGQFRAHTE